MFSSPKDKFEKLTKAFIDDCKYGRTRLSMLLKYMDLPDQYPILYQEGEQFFSLMLDTCIDSTYHTITKFFDTSNQGENINKYLQYVEKHTETIFDDKSKEEIEIIKKDIENDRLLLQKHDRQIKQLKNLRNKSIAHFSKENISNPDKVFIENPLSFFDIYDLYEIVADIIFKYYKHYSGKIEIFPYKDMKVIYDFLEELNTLVKANKKLKEST